MILYFFFFWETLCQYPWVWISSLAHTVGPWAQSLRSIRKDSFYWSAGACKSAYPLVRCRVVTRVCARAERLNPSCSLIRRQNCFCNCAPESAVYLLRRKAQSSSERSIRVEDLVNWCGKRKRYGEIEVLGFLVLRLGFFSSSDLAGNDREGVITWGLRDADIFSAGSRG